MAKDSSLNTIYIKRFLRTYLSRWNQSEAILLDLGCGDNRYKRDLEERTRKVVSVDLEIRSDNTALVSDARNLPFRSGSFDLVFLSEVIEHVSDPRDVLEEINRVLKMDGILLITWPLIHPLHEEPNDYFRMTEYGLTYLCYRTGFVVDEIYRRGDISSVLYTLIFGTGGALFTSLMRRIPVIWIRHSLTCLYQWIRMIVNWLISSFRPLVAISHLKKGNSLKIKTRKFLYQWTLGYCAVVRRVK